MRKNRNWFAATLAATLCLGTIGFATEADLAINSISIDKGRISVETENTSLTDTTFTLTVSRDSGVSGADKYYAVYMEDVKAGGTQVFQFEIPDNKNGVAGSGTYTVYLENYEDQRVIKQFAYADGTEVSGFVDLLKTEASKVTTGTEPYELLLPVINNPENQDVLFSIGFDSASYATKSDAVKQQTMNLLYQTGVNSLTADTLLQALNNSFAIAVYNSGSKSEGVTILAPMYNGAAIDTALADETANAMLSTYTSVEAFATDAVVAYGLATIKNANAGIMADTLAVYTKETGLCGEIIGKLAALDSVPERQAYNNVVLDIKNNGLSSNQTLQTILEKAYAAVTSGGTTPGGAGGSSGGFGGGSGGGAMGGKDNSTPVESGSASLGAGMGSGTTEQKVETFKDLSNTHWAYESVKWLKNRGIVNGTDAGNFEPDRQVTREEFAKMIVLASGMTVNNQSADFTDMADGAWYVPYIGAAADAGIVGGVGDGSFGIGRNITRQDMAVMAKRALDAKATQFVKVKDYTPFADADVFADYAMDAVKALFEAGIINGKGENLFDPNGTATRAEAAKIIYEAFKGVAI